MKKTLSILLSILMLMSVTAGLDLSAYADESNGIYQYTISNGEATITDVCYDYELKGSITIPNVLGGCRVTVIGKNAFEGEQGITDVKIPEGVTKIDNYGFSNCQNLSRITLPRTLKEIGKFALSGSNIKSINLSEGLIIIDDNAFNGCSALEKVSIPKGVTKIGINAFDMCFSLSEVKLPSTIKTISDHSFAHCYSLTKITIPEGVETIDGYAFSTCEELTNVTLPKSLKKIKAYAFADCYSISDVYYKSTPANWKKISIGTANDNLKNAQKHYKITVKAPKLKKLTAVKAGFKTNWGKVDSVSGYQIQYSLNKNFKSDKKYGTKKITVKKASTVNKTVSKLKKSKKYYVRVRAYKTVEGLKYYSSWSNVKSVKTK